MSRVPVSAAPARASRQLALVAPMGLAGPQAVLGLREAVTLIIGVVIGAGIFKAPSMVAAMAGSTEWMFGAWVLGGVISLIGALCYAELATAYPSAGGDYHFLRRAYGASLAFLFGWARFSVITTGSIALLAFVFGDYMNQALPLALFGGAPSPQPSPAAAPSQAPGGASFGLAMVFVLLTYGGWNEAAYVSAEIKNSRRNVVRALVLSIALITALYLLVNWAYWQGLGLHGMAGSQAIAADLLGVAFGSIGQKIMAVMVAIAALTSINATMIVGARSNYAVGRDWPVLQKLAFWDGARGTPVHAMRLQSLAALLLVVLGAWTGSGFRAMVEFTAPVFWLFFLLTGIALFVLRVREPDAERAYRVPLFPLLPLIFCASCAYMLWASLSYVYSQSLGGLNAAWIGVAVLAVGAALLLMMRLFPLKPEPVQPQTPSL